MKWMCWSICLLLLLIFLPASQASAKSFSIEQADLHAFILENGNLYVEELFTYRFSGTYKGTTRTIGDDHHEGVQYFEGYLVPEHTTITQYDPNIFQALKVERENLTFKIHTPSKDETKKVFYRYVIKGATKKYKDTGQLYWRFFDDMNESDLHNLSIRFFLYNDWKGTLQGQAFLHDLTGGSLSKTEKDGFLYKNKLLPAGKTVEIRYLFPETFLKDASFEKNEDMLEALLTEEKNYGEWLRRREQYSAPFEIINGAAAAVIIALFLMVICYPRRLYRLFCPSAPLERLQVLDSFLVAAIARKARFQHIDIVAALFRLQQRGLLSMNQTVARASYLEDEKAPNQTYRFTLMEESTSFAQYERELIDWLFKKDAEGQMSFSLDRLPFPTETERKENWRLENQYKKDARDFNKRFIAWSKTVQNDPEIREYIRPNPLRNWMLKLVVPLWIVWVSANVWYGSPDKMDPALAAVLLAAGWGIALSIPYKRFILPIYIFVGGMAAEGISIELPEMFTLSVVILALCSLLLPVNDITMKGAPLLKAVKTFKKSISSGAFDFKSRKSTVDRWYAHALSLRLFFPLKYFYDNQAAGDLEAQSHFLLPSASSSDIFYYPHYHFSQSYASADTGSSGSGSSGGSGGGGGAGAF